MRKYITKYIRTCDVCQKCKPTNQKPPGLMQSSVPVAPWDTLYLDLMGPYTKSYPGRFQYILVATDSFSKYYLVFPLRTATALAIGKIMENDIFCMFGMPTCLVTDNGANFKARTINYLCQQWNIKHRLVTVYHPQANVTERVNRNLKNLIKCYVLDVQSVGYLFTFLPTCA